jgi:hypothetical protein
MGFFGAPLAEIPENSTFAVPKGKISRKTQRSGRAVYCTGLENRRRESVRGFESLLLCKSPDFVGAFLVFKNR